MAQTMNPKSENYKRLIVLCDGTWQDSNADKVEFPTNVTRFARALRPTHTFTHTDEGGHKSTREVPQIVFYQPGPGSTSETKFSGGLYGHGVSATVRAAYAFLSHNYSAGDDIFFFGFSRGAYIARSVAGLVTSLGLLNKRGMDQFPLVYDTYYTHADQHMSPTNPEGGRSFEDTHSSFIAALEKGGYLHRGARAAVKIVGVWDTVGFHASGWGDEKIEFHNVTLSPLVRHAFHALALDETRWPFKPTLWRKPDEKALEKGRETLRRILAEQSGGEGEGRAVEEEVKFDQQLHQVWFSGFHSDIGGGLADPRLSDIALGWMIASCYNTGLLDFTDLPHSSASPHAENTGTPDSEAWNYLLPLPTSTPNDPASEEDKPWSTSLGPANAPDWFKAFIRRFIAEDRRPLTLTDPGTGYTLIINDGSTNEFVHESITDRDFEGWECPAVSGQWEGEKEVCKLKDQERQRVGVGLRVAGLVRGEEVFKGRIVGIKEDEGLKKAVAEDEKVRTRAAGGVRKK